MMQCSLSKKSSIEEFVFWLCSMPRKPSIKLCHHNREGYWVFKSKGYICEECPTYMTFSAYFLLNFQIFKNSTPNLAWDFGLLGCLRPLKCGLYFWYTERDKSASRIPCSTTQRLRLSVPIFAPLRYKTVPRTVLLHASRTLRGEVLAKYKN